MSRSSMYGITCIVAISTLLYFLPDTALAQFSGNFESKVGNLQSRLINTLLPLMSIFGMIYAGILAATGNESAKGKILLCVIGSIIGFLAPQIIEWLKASVG